jgi:glycosyltransferase involved in cell wall biosynthesis
MKKKKLIFTVTNNILQDQRMQRIANSLADQFDVYLIGRGTSLVLPLAFPFFTARIPCIFKKGKVMYLEFNLKLFFRLMESRVDAICAVDPDTLLACSCAAWIKRVPLIYDAHELFTEVPELEGRNFSKRIWSLIEKCGVSMSSIRYTVNASVARELEIRYGRPFEIIRNFPVALPYPLEKDRSSNRMIWYQGVLNVGRGIEEMIDALALLPDEWRFEIAGEGDIKPFLLEKVSSMGLSNRVKFHGHCTREEMVARSADAFAGLNLLRSDSKNYYLSLANKFFDYVQQGMPQFCMDFPEYKLMQDTYPVAVLINHIDPPFLAESILNLATDSMEYHDLQRAIMLARQDWIWENEALKLKQIYKTIDTLL